MEADIKKINKMNIEDFINQEAANRISENYWENTLPSQLEATSLKHPACIVFIASLVKNNRKAFLSKEILIRDMLDGGRGDIHHIYPKSYLVANRVKRNSYNQAANYAHCEQPINIKLSNLPPKKYLEEFAKQHHAFTEKELMQNFEDLAIPPMALNGEMNNYETFLKQRRKLMSYKIKEYYERL